MQTSSTDKKLTIPFPRDPFLPSSGSKLELTSGISHLLSHMELDLDFLSPFPELCDVHSLDGQSGWWLKNNT